MLRYDPTPNPILTTYTTVSSPPPWAVVPNELGNFPPGDTFGEEKDATVTEPIVKGNRTLVSIVDEVHRRGARMLDRVCPGGACDPTFGEADAALAGVMADLGASPVLAATETGAPSAPPTYDTAPYLGRARACWWNRASGTRFDVRVELDTEIESELLVVRGRDGLECAVRGSLEGVPSDVAQFAAQLPTTTAWRTTAAGVRWARVTQEPLGARPTASSIALFVVERRPQVEGPPAPGQYRELTGFVLPRPGSSAVGYQYCTGSAIAPRHESEAARLVEPSPTAPYRAAETCAGLPSDLRIPLENELTSDARPLESSWSHYLELAQRAATEADALGEDLVRTGLKMDLRSEAAADELSRLCGVSIHLTSIGDELDDALAAIAPGGPPCMVPYVQQGDQCVRDPVLYAATRATREEDMSRLAACIGADLVPWATLGDNELCIWDLDPATPGGICEGSHPRNMPCPFLSDGAGHCDAAAMPSGATPIVISERIGLFQRPAEPPPPPPDLTNLPCDALARARAGLASLDDATQVLGFLSLDNAQMHARQLGWDALVGDYSAVRYGGSIVFRTGSIATGPSDSWPMGATIPPGAHCPLGLIAASDPAGYRGPLFCLGNVGLGPREGRARVNDLLARAVMAARIFTGQGLRGLVLPYYADNRAELYREHEEDIAWAPMVTAPVRSPPSARTAGPSGSTTASPVTMPGSTRGTSRSSARAHVPCEPTPTRPAVRLRQEPSGATAPRPAARADTSMISRTVTTSPSPTRTYRWSFEPRIRSSTSQAQPTSRASSGGRPGEVSRSWAGDSSSGARSIRTVRSFPFGDSRTTSTAGRTIATSSSTRTVSSIRSNPGSLRTETSRSSGIARVPVSRTTIS